MTAAPTSAGATAGRALAVAYRQSLILRRSPHRLFDVTMVPFVDTLLFGSLGTFIAREGGSGRTSAAYLLVGIILWHVVYQAQIAVSAGFLEEAWSRNLLSLMVTPMRELEFLGGIALFGLAKLVLGVGGAAAAAFLLYAFEVTELGVGLLPIAVVLLVSGWALGLFVVGLVLRFGTGAESMAWGVMFLIMPLSGVFYSRDSLPAFLQPVSAVLPTTHAFAAGRALLAGHSIWSELRLAALTGGAFCVAAVTFAVLMLRLFLRRGYISRYL